MEDQPRGLWCVLFYKVKPYLAMVSLQLGYAGMIILCMLCLKRGMSHYVLVVYRHAVATLVVSPFALVFERPVIDQNLYYAGMNYTSAAFATATDNIIPAITFIMAIIFRLEQVKIKKLHSQAKIAGTLVTLAGAMVMTLYKGPILDLVWARGRSHHETSSGVTDQHWIGLAMIGLISGFLDQSNSSASSSSKL